VGFYYLDTTALANGVHTISWNVFDNVGHGDGIGSRYFNVFNSGGPVAALEEDTLEPATSTTRAHAVKWKRWDISNFRWGRLVDINWWMASGSRCQSGRV